MSLQQLRVLLNGLSCGGHLAQLLLVELLDAIRQRSIVERPGGGLAVSDDVLDEVLQRSPLVLVRTILRDDEEGEGGDRISIGRACRGVNDGLPRVLRKLR